MALGCPLCPSDISHAQRGKPYPMATPITLTLALSHQGRGDIATSQPLWIPACAGMTGFWLICDYGF